MALQFSKVLAEANALEEIANDLATVYSKAVQFLEHNSDVIIDWSAGGTPAYISEEANGNILGKDYTRQQVANLIGTLSQLKNLMSNAAVTQGDHLGNLNLIAKPLG